MIETFLRIPTAEETATCNAGMVVKSMDASDFPDWESRLLDPRNDPRPHMRKQRQRINDCQGQALANGTEKREWYCTGTMRQRSDMYAYNGSERIGGENRVGQNVGTSIQSGVILLTDGIKSIGVKPGLPTEQDWPYDVYEKSSSRFDQRAKAVTIDSGFVTEHGPMPGFQGMLIGCAAGGSGHIGTFWGNIRWGNLNGRRLMDQAPTNGGGHATEIIWAEKIAGRWYLVVWNSHDDAYYWMDQKTYETLARSQFAPFGGYLLVPDRAKERYHDRVASGGGYFRPRNQGVA